MLEAKIQALTTIEVAGLDVDVRVSADGKFSADFDGFEHESDTLAGLTRNLKAHRVRRKAKINVPFTYAVGTKVRAGAVTGVHAVTKNYMVLWEDGEREQVRPHDFTRYLRPLTPEERASILELAKKRETLNYEIERQMHSASFDVRQAVEEALTGAVRKADKKSG